VTRRVFARADPADYRRLDLRAHDLLGHVPLHDVWWVDLPGGPPEVSIDSLGGYLDFESFARSSPVVRGLFALRSFVGRVFGWDASRVPPGDGARVSPGEGDDQVPGSPFRPVFSDDREAIAEIRNATVHAFSVMALAPSPGGRRLYWAIYVAAVGPITPLYMALIDPFRRTLVYPAILRHVHRSWLEDHPR
jgi:hypothetical protein